MKQVIPDGTIVKFGGYTLNEWSDEEIMSSFENVQGGRAMSNNKKITVSNLQKRIGQKVKCELETYSELGNLEDEYYNITFPDGLTIYGVNGDCITKPRNNFKEAIIKLLEKYSGKKVILKEEGVLGQGMSQQAKAADVEQSDKEYIAQQQKKMPKAPAKIFTIKVSRPGAGGRFSSDTRDNYYTGTLEHLIKNVFGYTLEVGASWQREKGNKKINQNPRTAEQLAINLYNAKNNAARDGYSGYDFTVVPNEENPDYNKNVQESVKNKALIKLLEKYSGKKVVLKENYRDVKDNLEIYNSFSKRKKNSILSDINEKLDSFITDLNTYFTSTSKNTEQYEIVAKELDEAIEEAIDDGYGRARIL